MLSWFVSWFVVIPHIFDGVNVFGVYPPVQRDKDKRPKNKNQDQKCYWYRDEQLDTGIKQSRLWQWGS
jgi:hypothetical protein